MSTRNTPGPSHYNDYSRSIANLKQFVSNIPTSNVPSIGKGSQRFRNNLSFCSYQNNACPGSYEIPSEFGLVRVHHSKNSQNKNYSKYFNI